MRDLIARIPADVFWALLIGWGLGLLSAWRFTSLLERMRDAWRHARYHVERGTQFLRYVRDNVKALALSAVFLAVVTGAVGYVAWLRVSSGG